MACKAARKILVVEDDARMARMCNDVLSLAGYHVQTARDGIEALKMLLVTEFDLVISDVIMPGMSGLDLYSKFTRYSYSTSSRREFLFITGYAADLKSALTALGCEYLEKPFGINEFLARVDRLMVRSIVESMD